MASDVFYRCLDARTVTKSKVLLVALVFASCSPIRGCEESNFDLLPESRLPKWFSLPPGYSRSDVTVKLTYYTPLAPVDNVVFELVDQNGRQLAEVTGQTCWHPAIDKIRRNQYGGFDLGSEPRYVIARVDGVMEVIDHPVHGPVFQITDEPALVKEANNSLRQGECRKQ